MSSKFDVNVDLQSRRNQLNCKRENFDVSSSCRTLSNNISASVTQELKCKKPRQDNMTQQRTIKQASKYRIVDQQKISQTSEALQAVKLATPNQTTMLYTPESPKPQRERKE